MSKVTQTERILQYMREHPEGITALEALNDLGCFRLAARIHDLRAEGHQITEEPYSTSSAKRVSRYRLTGITQTPRTPQSKEEVKTPQPTAKLREWVCAQCGAAAAYIGASAAGDKYGLGKCFHHGTTAVMTVHRDVS
jgi:hypothetical protein